MESSFSNLSTAIGWTKKKVPDVNDTVQRWLDHNSRISFSLAQETSRNAEFYVNNNSNHRIWYSQLAEVFLHIETLTLCVGGIYKKNGEGMGIYNIDVKTFINYVKDRSFKVDVNPDGEVAKFDRKTLPDGISYIKAQELIASLVGKGDYKEAAKYLLPATQYNLIEL